MRSQEKKTHLPDTLIDDLKGCGAEMDGLVTAVIYEAATSQHNLFIPG